MKNVISFIFLLALLVSGCSQEEMLKNGTTSVSGKGRTFTTEFEQNDSRTYVENGHLSRWTEGDLISLFDASTLNCQYQFAGDTGDSGGTFFILNKPEGTGTALNTMFSGCTNLEQASRILPATILTNFCYRSMFENCSNLTESPILPAPVLTPYCYEWMFSNCSKLTTVTVLAVDTKAEHCLYSWLYNVSSTGTLYKSPLVKSVSQVPCKWTQIDYKE